MPTEATEDIGSLWGRSLQAVLRPQKSVLGTEFMSLPEQCVLLTAETDLQPLSTVLKLSELLQFF